MINKIEQVLGYNHLAFIIEQEMKHWLLKTDKNKMFQDKETGSIYQGKLNNMGSDIVIETQKTNYIENALSDITFSDTNASKVLSFQTSTLPYSSSVNGLLFSRIISTLYPLPVGRDVKYEHFKIRFSNCTIVKIPFSSSSTSSNVYCGEWLCTTSAPTLLMIGNDMTYSISKSLSFNNNVTNPVWYFPLSETLQSIPIESVGGGNYETEPIENDELIGYPLYWFTCDNTNVGPTLSFTNNTISNGKLLYIGNEGNSSKYNAKIYCGLDGENDATPSSDSTSDYQIKCTCLTGYTFNGTEYDKSIPLNNVITFINKTTAQETNVTLSFDDNNIINLDLSSSAWVRENDTATIEMDVFDNNCYAISQNALLPLLSIHFDETVSFMNTTTDYGFSGIQIDSSNKYSDKLTRYPYDLNKWDGLPSWLNEIDDDGLVPQHMCIYAIHNTPEYTEGGYQIRQTAALLFDPGKLITEDSDETTANDEKGRIYYISNDSIEYENNKTALYKKPERTVARICDIPTSFTQLSNITGIAPTAVVDKKYVRSETCYYEEDRDRLYNILSDRWVKPTALDQNGYSIKDTCYDEDNNFVFHNANNLNNIDMVHHNDFRHYINLNPKILSSDVTLGAIKVGGAGYNVDDIGSIIVGGLSFNYVVTEVDTNGAVTELTITSSHQDEYISLSNFDMPTGVEEQTGETSTYGTSPITQNSGVGLQISFFIPDYNSLITQKGTLFEDLFALVKDASGLWLYRFIVHHDESSPTPGLTGYWAQDILLSEADESSVTADGVSVSESYINSIIPTVRTLPISLQENKRNQSTLNVYQTATFVNIVDNDHVPYEPIHINTETPSTIPVDMCKWYCNGLHTLTAPSHTPDAVLGVIKINNYFKFDCYIFWDWINESSNEFVFGIIQRSFNNYMTTDNTTLLPKNELTCDNYVHTNQSSYVVWDTNDIGPMMWMYNPASTIKESYVLEPTTFQLNVARSQISWRDVDIRSNNIGTDEYPPIVDENGFLNYNILTNNPQQSPIPSSGTIYRQPEMIQLDNLVKGTNISDAPLPLGNWQLVFPRINSFKFSNGNNLQFNPILMQTIKSRNTSNPGIIRDENNNDISNRVMIIDQNSNGVELKLYNSDTQKWNKI